MDRFFELLPKILALVILFGPLFKNDKKEKEDKEFKRAEKIKQENIEIEKENTTTTLFSKEEKRDEVKKMEVKDIPNKAKGTFAYLQDLMENALEENEEGQVSEMEKKFAEYFGFDSKKDNQDNKPSRNVREYSDEGHGKMTIFPSPTGVNLNYFKVSQRDINKREDEIRVYDDAKDKRSDFKEDLLRGIIMSEILSEPKSRRI